MKEKLREIVNSRGGRFLTDRRCINILADYKVFRDNPAAKFVLKTFIQEGYMSRLIQGVENKLRIDVIRSKMVDELYQKNGFRRDILIYVMNAMLYAFNLPEIPEEATVDAPHPPTPVPSPADDHIVFSGISLSHSLKEIEAHMKSRGFVTKRRGSFQITMKGTFGDLYPEAELLINGSPSGLIKNINVSYEDDTPSILFKIGDKLNSLLLGKYGSPAVKEDKYDIINKNIQYYYDNILWFERLVNSYTTIYKYIWHVTGGKIELRWHWNYISLTYFDTINKKLAESHQKQFNKDSI